MTKIDPVEKAILDQHLEAIRVFVKQYQKTPSTEMLDLATNAVNKLNAELDIQLAVIKKYQRKRLKITGKQCKPTK